MILPSPVTVQPPSYTRKNGEVRTYAPKTISELDITIIDNVAMKSVVASLRGFPRALPLWSGEAYDAIGDYTQAQVEARVLEVLGEDPKAALEQLFGVAPVTPPAA